ncbi:MAG TPA: glutamine amidotransferase [Polyangiaceae bacterium]|nr:glutamine amidotransferase [Polyangiaceae bacterium]
MPTTHLSTHGDLPVWAVWLACGLAGASLVLLVFELRRRERGGVLVAGTGLMALAALLLSVVRPVRVAAKESIVGARVAVLADASRSMQLPDEATTRLQARDAALDALERSAKNARLVQLGFGDGAPTPLRKDAAGLGRSDLASALRALADAPEERPAAIVVVSDGRLDDPPEGATKATLAPLGALLHVPIHAIATTRAAPPDASIRHVTAAGAAVAHVPMPLRIEIGCSGGLACDELTVTARELHHDGAPTLLASGLAHVKDGTATLELPITLERAGIRVVEVALSGASGDAIPENDRRLVTFSVTRERVRVLHVAGRPTNDVRALRQWLKGDASVDLVAFFILRTPTDNVNASQDELALIPFPVDELFSEHLPSFDAVVLQDFDAQPYGLERHLPALASYVRSGGGLVMVGGPNSFVAGGYAGTPLADVLPVQLDSGSDVTAADPAPFVPEWTDLGRETPMLGPLRSVLGDELPDMPGANVLEDARPNALVLWTHPRRKTKSGHPMPVLAVADVGNGRSVALGVDGGWELLFSDLGARTGGRGHGALWDGLLGWLMRDPRFEPAQLELPNGCVAKHESTLRVRAVAPRKGAVADVAVEVTRMDEPMEPVHLERKAVPLGVPLELGLPALPAGGYSAMMRVGDGAATRLDFACEAGGDEWADSRPDPDRLRALADATGGSFRFADDASPLPLPKATVVSTERHVSPLAPPWAWALLAAMCVGAHWYARRKSGLT